MVYKYFLFSIGLLYYLSSIKDSDYNLVLKDYSKKWDELSKKRQELWIELGWTPELWDNDDLLIDHQPISFTKCWKDLNYIELNAAISLGFKKENWDNDDYEWKDLNSLRKKEWVILGWNELNWNKSNLLPESEYKIWIDLSEEEKIAATNLGYNKDIWDEDFKLWKNLEYNRKKDGVF